MGLKQGQIGSKTRVESEQNERSAACVYRYIELPYKT